MRTKLQQQQQQQQQQESCTKRAANRWRPLSYPQSALLTLPRWGTTPSHGTGSPEHIKFEAAFAGLRLR